MKKSAKTSWIPRSWQPVAIGFVPSKKAWEREMVTMGQKKWPYPTTAAACTAFVNTHGNHVVLITVAKAATRDPDEIVGLIVHEATHAWQHVKKVICEEAPGAEMEAYAIQGIVLGLLRAYSETRGAA